MRSMIGQKSITATFSALAFSAGAFGAAQMAPEASGVYTWCSWNPEQTSTGVTENIVGVPLVMHWNQIEPRDGVFEFDQLLGERLKGAAESGFHAFIMIWVGPSCPEWLYEKGVPKVLTDRKVNALGQATKQNRFPYYLDPIYKKHFFRMIEQCGKYVDSLPEDLKRRIVYVQSAEGSTGDGQGYKGRPLEKKYEIDKETWGRFRIETWNVFKKHFQDEAKRPLPLLVNGDANKGPEVEWLFATQDIIAVKHGMFSHGYHISENQERFANWRETVANADAAGKSTFTRGEMDGELYVMGWSKRNVPQALYWSAVHAIHCGLDQWNVPWQSATDEANQAALEFFNRYAGKRDASNAPFAFCALRRGLDAADSVLFPEDEFGELSKRNQQRYVKIAEAFKDYGAYQGDPQAATGGGMLNRKRTDYNDAGWGILPGNYSRFLDQIAPDESSVAWWHKGPEQHIYSRFARGFEQKSGKTAMYFRLAEGFYKDIDAPKSAQVRIAWLDEGQGAWELVCSDGGEEKQVCEVVCGASGEWKEKSFDLKDAVFNHSLEKGADLILRHLRGDDVAFHIVELKR